MKAYIITLFNLPQSVAIAQRCSDSAQQFGLEPVLWPGVWRDQARTEMFLHDLKLGEFDTSWSNTEAVIGNFIAQYRAWQTIARSDEGALIMEHDAVVVAPITPDMLKADIVTLGKPSFGKVRIPPDIGLQPVFSSKDKIPGAHGYYVSPAGAALLCQKAKEIGVHPVDKFISPLRLPQIREYYPWSIEARDSFTTIQKTKGCLSKHNWDVKKYQIL